MKKEFNIEDYLTGKYDVVTRDGKKVRILATDVKNQKPVVCVITKSDGSEYISQTTTTGRLFTDNYAPSDRDLVLVSKTRKYHRVHYLDNNNNARDIMLPHCNAADNFVKHYAQDHHYKVLRIEEVEIDEELLNK